MDWNFFAEPEPTCFLQDFGHGEIPGATGISGYPNPKGSSLADVTHRRSSSRFGNHRSSLFFTVFGAHYSSYRYSSEEL